MAGIHFFTEDVAFKLNGVLAVKRWLRGVIAAEGYKTGHINFIFCSDDYLLNVNREYLQHDYYTDIITFDNSEKTGTILSDIFISIDRVTENAALHNTGQLNELRRIMVHGILHLCGYGDKSKADKAAMTAKEDFYLAQFPA